MSCGSSWIRDSLFSKTINDLYNDSPFKNVGAVIDRPHYAAGFAGGG